MKKVLASILSAIFIFSMTMSTFAAEGESKVTEYPGASNIKMSVVGHYDSQSGEGGTEIVAYAKKAKKMFVVNGEAKALDIIDISGLTSDGFVEFTSSKRIGIEELQGVKSAKDITSVAVAKDESFVAVAVPADPKQDPGSVVLMDVNGNHIATYETGALPDMVKVTPDNQYILVANEGEPNDEYTVDPEGSVTVINISEGVDKGIVTEVKFTDESIIEKTIRKANPSATYAESLEPEYMDVNKDSTKAYVVCQESNAVAVLDIKGLKFDKVIDLGVKDYSVKGNEIDASNKDDAINFMNYPVLSYYQPDGVDMVTIGGKDYLFTANEGDSQDYDGYSEEVRVADIASNVALKADNYAGYTQEELDTLVADGLFDKEKLGRLKITTANGKNDAGKYEAIYGYGGRSFSIYDAETMALTYDSGNDFEMITAKASPDHFNTTNDELAFDDRSDDKGPEPENVVVGLVGNSHYAFIGLERFGGIMAYNVDDVKNPVFELYTTTRAFDESMGGDLAPEGLEFIAASDSPTGKALLLVGNEVSGTVVIYQVESSSKEAAKTPAQDTDTAPAKVPAQDTKTTPVKTAVPEIEYTTYIVKTGDKLWTIAKMYNMTYQELHELNSNIKNAHMIYVGQEIKVPVK